MKSKLTNTSSQNIQMTLMGWAILGTMYGCDTRLKMDADGFIHCWMNGTFVVTHCRRQDRRLVRRVKLNTRESLLS